MIRIGLKMREFEDEDTGVMTVKHIDQDSLDDHDPDDPRPPWPHIRYEHWRENDFTTDFGKTIKKA